MVRRARPPACVQRHASDGTWRLRNLAAGLPSSFLGGLARAIGKVEVAVASRDPEVADVEPLGYQARRRVCKSATTENRWPSPAESVTPASPWSRGVGRALRPPGSAPDSTEKQGWADNTEILARFHAEAALVDQQARALRRRIPASTATFDDLCTFGLEGLLDAARRFDPARGVPAPDPQRHDRRRPARPKSAPRSDRDCGGARARACLGQPRGPACERARARPSAGPSRQPATRRAAAA
jgi:hypothetical protein